MLKIDITPACVYDTLLLCTQCGVKDPGNLLVRCSREKAEVEAEACAHEHTHTHPGWGVGERENRMRGGCRDGRKRKESRGQMLIKRKKGGLKLRLEHNEGRIGERRKEEMKKKAEGKRKRGRPVERNEREMYV